MAPRFLEVAVPVPLPRTFTYELPADFPMPPPGGRVLVPFGRRVLVAYVVGPAGGETGGEHDIKAVLDVLDERAILPPSLMELAQRLARYYAASPGEAVRLMYPRGVDPLLVRRIRMHTPAQELPALLADPGGPVLKLIEALGRARKPTVEALKARLKDLQVYRMLVQLRQGGHLEWEVEPHEVRRRAKDRKHEVVPDVPPVLTPEQDAACATLLPWVEQRTARTALLFGTTGSGKTEVYLRLIQRALELGGQALYLVPEIALTSLLAQRLRARFGDRVAIFHSGLGESERVQLWHGIGQGKYAIAAGPRSVLFAPLPDLRVIVVDEEHDGSYKQEEHPRYHARDMAILRGHLEKIPVVLGSATPAVESFAAAGEGKYELLELPGRVPGAHLPEVETVDMRATWERTGEQMLVSPELMDALQGVLQRGEQAILLRNRRGFFSSLLCRACGEIVQCRHCSVALTYHKHRDRLRCHLCGFSRPLPTRCPVCREDALQFLGHGTEQVEEALIRLLPTARVGRLDRDTAREPEELEAILTDFAEQRLDILVGTQMVAKGHHFPRVSLVGVLAADAALGLPDFRAGERTFQLLTQVSGRAGRGEIPGRALLQVFNPDHPVVKAALAQDYRAFYEREIGFRQVAGYPPASWLALLLFTDADREKAFAFAHEGVSFLRGAGIEGLRILGPGTAPLERMRNRWRVQVLLKAPSRGRIQSAVHRLLADERFLKAIPAHLEVDVDPVSVM